VPEANAEDVPAGEPLSDETEDADQEAGAEAPAGSLDTVRITGKGVIWVLFMGLSLLVIVLVAAALLSSMAEWLFR
jgi:hypothetical protein